MDKEGKRRYVYACYNTVHTYTHTHTEEIKVDKKIGFFHGIREILGFRPYLFLFLMELFAWLAVQVGCHGNSARSSGPIL